MMTHQVMVKDKTTNCMTMYTSIYFLKDIAERYRKLS